MPKLVKNFKTVAEESGLSSTKDVVKNIEKVVGVPKASKAPKAPKAPKATEAPEPQVIYVQMAPPKKERKKRVLTEEQRDALRERLVKARASKASKKTIVE